MCSYMMAVSNRIIVLAVLVVAVLSNPSLLAKGQIVNGSEIEDIRLVDHDGATDSNQGRVEIMYNGTWGTICGSYYSSWYTSDARVACRMLGFEDALCAVRGGHFGRASSSSPIWMTDVYCNGYESALDLCYFSGWGVHNYYYDCSHSNDAGVICLDVTEEVGIPSDIRLIKSSATSLTIGWTAPAAPSWAISGRFGIRYQSDHEDYAQYRTYYNSSFINDTDVEMSYTLTSLIRNTWYSIQIRAEVHHTDCSSYTYTYGNYSDPISLQTNATLRQSSIPVRLASPTPGLHFLGRVEVFYNNQWGTVCDDYFGTTEANVICQMLNFTQGAECSVGYAQFGQGQGPIWLDNVECQPGDEILEECDHNSWGNTSCSHREDVGVVCRPNPGDIKSAVQNLTVLSVNASSITVGWSQYTFPSGAYVYYTGYQLQYTDSYGYTRTAYTYSYYGSPSNTQYTLSRLQIGEEYTISVRAFFELSGSCYSYIYSAYSNNVTATTMETAPSAPPRDFYVVAINRTAIQADWDLPPDGYRGGLILGYRLYIQSLDSGAEWMINITDNSTVYIVGGLQPATEYRLSVLAYTNVGDGPKSIYLTVSTLRYDPLITHFGYYGNGQDRITRYAYNYDYYYYYGRVHIHCASSNFTFAPPHWYFANGSRIGVRDRNFQAGLFPNGTAVLKIADYRPLSYCDGGIFTCRVNNSVSGHSQEKKFTLTINDSPPSPDRPFLIKAQSTSLTIGWSEATCNGGHTVNNFNIRFSQSSSYSRVTYTYIRDIDPLRRNYTITRLQANTDYSFSIQAVNWRARSSSYSSSFSATTLPPAPSAPRDVTARLVAPLKVEVRWRAPAVTNGDISHYYVYAIPLRSTVSNNTLQTLQMAFPGSARAGNITLVVHSITYQFRVSAAVSVDRTFNEGDLSSVSPNTSLFVPKPGLPKPTNPHVTNSTNSSITLMWNYPPPPSEAIEKFFVSYSSEIQWISPENYLVTFEDRGDTNTSTNSVKISALVPGTTYTFKVSAITPSGRGAEVMVTGTTDNNVSLAYFQFRMGPVRSCYDFMDFAGPNTDDREVVRSGLVQEFSHLCPGCGVTAANIKNHVFSCHKLSRQIVYRARMVGTDTHSASELVSLMKSWVESDEASVMVDSTRFHLDPACYTILDSPSVPDCTPPPSETTTSIFTTAPSTSAPVTSVPSTSTSSTPAPVPISGSISAGEIGGIAVGVVIVLLLIILIVVIICKKWRPKVIRRYGHRGFTHIVNDDEADDIPFVVDGGDEDNNPTLHFDEDKDEQSTLQ